MVQRDRAYRHFISEYAYKIKDYEDASTALMSLGYTEDETLEALKKADVFLKELEDKYDQWSLTVSREDFEVCKSWIDMIVSGTLDITIGEID